MSVSTEKYMEQLKQKIEDKKVLIWLYSEEMNKVNNLAQNYSLKIEILEQEIKHLSKELSYASARSLGVVVR